MPPSTGAVEKRGEELLALQELRMLLRLGEGERRVPGMLLLMLSSLSSCLESSG
jgi:hypothetical protein